MAYLASGMRGSAVLSTRSLGRLSLLGAGLIVAQSVGSLVMTFFIGEDFLPLRNAGRAILHGQSVYTDPNFVYPPTAAPLFVPLALGPAQLSFGCYLALSILGLFVAAGLIARAAPQRLRLPVLAAGVLALLTGPVAAGSLFLGNLSVLLVPATVLILVAFHQQRWLLGCALLVATLLIKPLLAPLLLVPAVRRRWLELLWAVVPGLAVLVLAVLLVPGGRDFGQVLSYCLSGTNLHGANAINNLSLRGWGEAHHLDPMWGSLASMLVALIVLARLVQLLRRHGAASVPPLQLANLALLVTMLTGRIAEVHFLLCLLAGMILHLTVQRSRRLTLLALPGLIMLGAPQAYLGLVAADSAMRQSWLVAAELLLLLPLLARPPVRPAPAGGRPARRAFLVPA
ncbi:MAG TPA: glycosyltransferase family 87 protein [Jatrophihabitans sp.]|nr:glycosyltransferase family 87 protein [Jatrophihabitans sp.]